MYKLLRHVGLRPDDVVITNSVLCLPAKKSKKHKVYAAQQKNCLRWLDLLITIVDPSVVVCCGRVALQAANRLHKHNHILEESAGKTYDWKQRKLLPLYHPSNQARKYRSEQEQLEDIMYSYRNLSLKSLNNKIKSYIKHEYGENEDDITYFIMEI